MPALTESEARARAALLTVDSYDVSIDLTVTPVLSRTVIRFRCARPGAASFADLTARVRGGGAALNGVPLDPPADGRLPLGGLAAENLLTIEAEIPDRGLTRFAEPSGGADYVRGTRTRPAPPTSSAASTSSTCPPRCRSRCGFRPAGDASPTARSRSGPRPGPRAPGDSRRYG